MDWLVIGINIKRWRAFKGIKQVVLAKHIGISRVMLSRYENGRAKISLTQLETIADKLEITLNDLLNFA